MNVQNLGQTANYFKVKIEMNYFIWITTHYDTLMVGPETPRNWS